MKRTILLACLLLAACGSAEDAPEQAATTGAPVTAEEPVAASDPAAEPSSDTGTTIEAPVPALDGEGLRMVAPSGSTRLLAFGMGRTLVENAVARALGQGGTKSRIGECGAGPMEFSKLGGLKLNFQNDKFIGWSLQPPATLTTIDGIGIGRTKAEIENSRTLAMVEGSTLGEEFSIGGIGGFLDGEGGTVSMLYAGTQCFFR